MGFTGHHPRSTKRLYTPIEAAESLGLSRSRIYQLLSGGAIKWVDVEGQRRITAAALDAFVASLPVVNGGTE